MSAYHPVRAAGASLSNGPKRAEWKHVAFSWPAVMSHSVPSAIISAPPESHELLRGARRVDIEPALLEECPEGQAKVGTRTDRGARLASRAGF